jgi:hypothetical protein
VADSALLARRLANLRRTIAEIQANAGTAPGALATADSAPARAGRERTAELAARLAADLDGEVVRMDVGTVVRVEAAARPMALDREALARLPGQPPADVPLVCLDTETTGLGSAAGTVAFLIGLGWWEGQRFRQVQLLLPDHPEERALLHALAAHIPPDAWLVTYNGRGFDWPLLVARYRMVRQEPPPHAGHLDLLTTVRRIFKHRMADARLRTAEEALLGFGRVDDVEGWEIPGRYLTFLRGGSAGPLVSVADHNDRDVRSLARLLAHLAGELGDEDRRRSAPDGDLLGLARCFRIEGRLDEAMACLDLAVERPAGGGAVVRRRGKPPEQWLVDRSDGIAAAIAQLAAVRTNRVMRDHVARERARLLRHVGRLGEARQAWRDLGTRNGPLSAVAWIELAKVMEHVDRDVDGALAAVADAERLALRAQTVGQPVPFIEADLARRRARLERRRAGAAARSRGRGRSTADRSDPAALPSALAHAVAYG